MKVIAVLAAMTLAVSAEGGVLDGCEHEAAKMAGTAFAGAKSVRVIARAGSLKVTGVDGANQVSVRGRACSSSRSQLEKIDLTVTRSGSEIVVEAVMPSFVIGYSNNSLDLEVTMPGGVPLSIEDSSGEMTVENVGSLTIDDSSGGIVVRRIRGNLAIEDSSGAIDVQNVAGDVSVEDSSGDIDVKTVGGNVVVEDDSSGAIDIRGVKKNVTVQHDSSGAIRVADVGGNFTVADDGSGGIEFDRVAGKVKLPRQ